MMLETDDVDDDYFTPVASTSLANIFGTSSKKQEPKENESLKYTPPNQQRAALKPDDSKVTQCVFATALVGYEWVDKVYTCRGNLGFAILKILKTGIHNIILYDSRKTSLSSTIITPTLEVTINNNKCISYYDNLQKYWSLYVSEECLKSIISLLKSFNVQIKHSSHANSNPPEPKSELNKPYIEEHGKKDIGSDTDSSINRKTKKSILNRMAHMGHSVLPSNTNVKEESTDTSDTSENIAHNKTINRHKPVKNVIKKLNIEKKSVLCTQQKVYEHEQNQIALHKETIVDKPILYSYVNGVLVPVTSTSLISNSVDRNINNMDLFVNEQRMNNTEMRINVNRITDKVEHILQKLNNIEEKDANGGCAINLETSVYQKLLLEYENKIKMYEDLLKTKNIDSKYYTEENNTNQNELEKKVQELKINIEELEQKNQEKSNEISRLGDELVLLQKNENNDLLGKIKTLEAIVCDKDAQLNEITNKCESLLQIKNENNIDEKVKNIMNNTYQTISGNFENKESYSGETIKKIIGVVIRNITLSSLNVLNSSKTNTK